MEVPITLAKREIGVRAASASRVILQILLIFRNRQVVQFASEQAIGVLELTLIRAFGFSARWFRTLVFQRTDNCVDGIVCRERAPNRRFIHRTSPAHFRLRLSNGDARGRKQHRQSKETGCAAGDIHLAVAKATLVIPASVQVFSTPTMFLYAPASSPRITTACSGFS